jgi:hypothetical protein
MKRKRQSVAGSADITLEERDLILEALFDLTISFFDTPEKIARCREVATKLGGDPDALWFGVDPGATWLRHAMPDRSSSGASPTGP